MEQSSGSQIGLRIPPVAWAGCAAAGAEDALVHPIELGPILLALQNLFPRHRRRALPFQPRLYALILVIEIGHVHHQILDHVHVRQRRDHRGRSRRNLRQAGEAVTAVDVHRAGPADPFPTRAPERERRIDLVLDLDQSVEDHGPTLFEVYVVVLKLRLPRFVGVPSVD